MTQCGVTGVADQFALEHAEVIEGVAEHAGTFQPSNEDGVALDGHVEQVAGFDPEDLAVFRRNDDTPEMVDAPGNPARSLVARLVARFVTRFR